MSNPRPLVKPSVRRGLARALKTLEGDIEVIRTEYREHGMNKRDLEDYEQALEWIRQHL